MNISVDLFMKSLPIMAKGWLGVFIVTLAIMAVVVILNKATDRK